MLTLGEFIAVISVCIASFSLGYKLGKDSSSKATKHEQEQPPRSGQLSGYNCQLIRRPNRLAGGTFFMFKCYHEPYFLSINYSKYSNSRPGLCNFYGYLYTITKAVCPMPVTLSLSDSIPSWTTMPFKELFPHSQGKIQGALYARFWYFLYYQILLYFFRIKKSQ